MRKLQLVASQNCRNRRSIGVAVAVALAAGVFLTGRRAAGGPGTPREDVYRAVGALLARNLPRTHLSRRPLDEAMGARALDLFLNALDPEHVYFTQDDVAALKQDAGRFDRRLVAGDLDFARQAFNRLKERARDRVAFAERFLSVPPKTDSDWSYRWRRRDEPWPADDAERDTLWQGKLINDVIARMVSVRLADEDRAQRAEAGAEAPPDAAADDEGVSDRNLSPEAFVIKRYRQFLQVLEDSDDEWIADRFFSAFTQSYDPHSEYLSAVRSEDFDINMKLSLVGIGAVLSTEDGMARIVRLIPGGPAERDGRLRPGDRIVAVAQGDAEPVDVLHWPLYKVVRLIRGEIGTRVTLTVWPAADLSGATERRIEIVRDEVKLEDKAARGAVREVPAAGGKVRRLAVVTLPEFYADFKGMSNGNGEEARRSSRDVRNLLISLQKDNGGFDGLILDLRNNGGGSLPDAIELAGLFIRAGPIVQVRDTRSVQVATDPDPRMAYGGPMIVLVNRLSASASEIVAAALQDYRRALIIGDSKTHGKGTVQTLLPLDRSDPALGQLKVTTAAFYRISGGSTQRRGVEPDIVIPSFLDVADVGEEFLPHALEWSAVDRTFYSVFANQLPDVATLRAASEERRRGDARFETWERTRNQLAERMKSADLPLNLEARVRLARAERELDRMQEELDTTEREREKDDSKDLVLQEALQILSDIVAWREARQAQPAEASATEPAEVTPAAPVEAPTTPETVP